MAFTDALMNPSLRHQGGNSSPPSPTLRLLRKLAPVRVRRANGIVSDDGLQAFVMTPLYAGQPTLFFARYWQQAEAHQVTLWLQEIAEATGDEHSGPPTPGPGTVKMDSPVDKHPERANSVSSPPVACDVSPAQQVGSSLQVLAAAAEQTPRLPTSIRVAVVCTDAQLPLSGIGGIVLRNLLRMTTGPGTAHSKVLGCPGGKAGLLEGHTEEMKRSNLASAVVHVCGEPFEDNKAEIARVKAACSALHLTSLVVIGGNGDGVAALSRSFRGGDHRTTVVVV